MSEIIQTNREPLPAPLPRTPIEIRPATLADIPFMDRLQKMHSKQVGFMPTKQFEGKIALGHVLVAEASGPWAVGSGQNDFLPSAHCPPSAPTPVGYCIGNDQYFKRDDVGIIYQMNVEPGRQRGYVGAALLRAMFDRAAYGCRLFCCWCAQDIAANRFWESMGFVALAYRAGSRVKGAKGTPRVHIFWQKRIRAGDTTTPWWFPAQTSAGSIREDRLVLPIPPGVHWSDAKPIILPGHDAAGQEAGGTKLLEERPARKQKSAARGQKSVATPIRTQRKVLHSVLRFGEFSPEADAKTGDAPKERSPKEPRKKVKNDPKHVAAARELRDRYLEEVNERGFELGSAGKYDLVRQSNRTSPRPLQEGSTARLLSSAA